MGTGKRATFLVGAALAVGVGALVVSIAVGADDTPPDSESPDVVSSSSSSLSNNTLPALQANPEDEPPHFSAHFGPGAPSSSPLRRTIRGNAFPDGVLALTWDDGPDAKTIELAKYLAKEHVVGTFFVVGAWVDGISVEPGTAGAGGANVYETGYEHMNGVLRELTSLGHRVGGHTKNHALLTELPVASAQSQLEESIVAAHNAALDSEKDKTRVFFRAPGGAWTDEIGEAIGSSKITAAADAIGPVHWDIDAKDWDSSLYCRSDSKPDVECEPGPIAGEKRVRADVIARRYLSQIDSMKHGIVLMHDRVGHVGSTYALDLAKKLIPTLTARHYVFAAPVLAFGRLASPETDGANPPSLNAANAFGDIDGDGRPEICHLASKKSFTLVCTGMGAAKKSTIIPVAIRAGFEFALADVDGDHHADLCSIGGSPTTMTYDVHCATKNTIAASASLPVEETQRDTYDARDRWLHLPPWHSFALGDIDGDGRADICGYSVSDDTVTCAKSTGSSFGALTPWLTHAANVIGKPPRDRLLLGDLDGDHRADICGEKACVLSNGSSFNPAAAIAIPLTLGSDERVLGDLNGDGASDLCSLMSTQVRCAFSTAGGHSFTEGTTWSSLGGAMAPAMPQISLPDLNGDHRADLCVATEMPGREPTFECALAP